MLTYNTDLKSALDVAATKSAWSGAIAAALGDDRNIRLFIDADPTAMDPVQSGTEFFKVRLTGPMNIVGGDIKGFGKTSDITIRNATDLTTGKAALRIEGGGNWVQGSLGLTRDAQIAAGVPAESVIDYDFMLSGNPTVLTGLAFSLNCSIRAPMFLPSGTGPVAPEATTDDVVAFRYIDYTDEANPVASRAVTFATRDPDMVMDIPFMAAEYGDVRIQRTPDGEGLVVGSGGECFKIAGMSWHMTALNNSEANVPVQQVEIRARPHNRWASHPFKRDLDTSYDVLIMGPHKIELIRANGSVADVIEMYSTRDASNTPGSGKPVNFAGQQSSSRNSAIQPWFTSNMVHAWWSHKPKYHSKRKHLIPPVDSGAMAYNNVSSYVSCMDHWPSYTGDATFNGLNTWRVAPKWSRTSAQQFEPGIFDPFVNKSQMARDGYMTQAFGWGYEPASNCLHVWYNPPGGSRHDRGPFPTSITTWNTDPDGLRPHQNTPYNEMMHHWCMGYFNHSQYFFTDVERGDGIPKSKILNGEICYNDTYYRGANENFRPDIENNAVRLLAALSKKKVGNLDKYGRRFTNEYSRDNQHNQSTAAVAAYTYISPQHVYAARHSFTSSVLANFDMTQKFDSGQFLMRQHAWHMLQFVNAWIVSNSDYRNFSKNDIETMWQRHLEQVYDAVYLRWRDGTDIYARTLRNLGMHGIFIANVTETQNAIELDTDSKACYMGASMMLMKQSGSWDAMRAKSVKCALALDVMVKCLAKFSINVFAEGNGLVDRFGGLVYYPNTQEPPISGWAEYIGPRGVADWVTPANGDRKSEPIDSKNTMHFRAQTARILYDFFPEYNFEFAKVAVDKVDGWYKVMEDAVAAGTANNFGYRFSMMGLYSKPALIGPPA